MKVSDIKSVRCLFEQSGHFRDIFKLLDLPAFDYDIDNQFNETDFQVDLFNEIEKAYNNQVSIFDSFDKYDLIVSFFPCVRFSQFSNMLIKCNQLQLKDKCLSDKFEISYNYKKEQTYFYELWCKMFIVVARKGLKMIVENPKSKHNYLIDNFPLEPAVSVDNRLLYGDNFEKPTNFWFIGFEPIFQFNHYLPLPQKKKLIDNRYTKDLKQEQGINRSLINKEFVKWFLQEYIFEDIDFNIRS